MKTNRDLLPATLFAIFAVSGFAGLIYESVWTHYLKLFLGHAAYAQTLVLSIFMGGLAVGSWIAGRMIARWRSPLLIYALIEGLIGLTGLGFNNAFQAFTTHSFETVIPWLGESSAIQAYKWSTAALSILPQSVLLGMTFPLMSVALIRHRPATPGSHLSMLYFTNSIGAAAGVLASGFLLIPNVGLPGAMLTAGLLNILVGLASWLVWRRLEAVPATAAAPAREEVNAGPGFRYPFLLFVALVTGLASFLYEIGWIRMLTLVLGSSTHAFELMLSAFIFGLACGGLWIRSRIDRLADSLAALGIVQVAMALLALSTLFAYGKTFDLMSGALDMFSRSETGYLGFNASSHLIAIFIMVPTTFCAGMTLPLLTHAALRRGIGERAVGGIYAANTVGAILGVAAAVHLVMPALGTKGVIMTGAAFDFVLGLMLLAAVPGRRSVLVALVLGIAGFGLSLGVASFEPQRLVSGVYRTGKAIYKDIEVLFHRDGKTASVSLVRDGSRILLSTNGKTDASISVAPDGEPSLDEITQNLSGALPLALHPKAKTAAVIGFGSGMTSAMLLAHAQLERVETIEIEPLMVEAARLGMMPRNRAVFEDPRSSIHIEDAKTFLSTRNRQYDIIVSEPSNPWVSGVASLFSREFYVHARRHLEEGGILVQWMQLYEIEFPLVASVMRALSSVFPDYTVYNVDSSNILIVARKGGRLEPPSGHIFESPALRDELWRVGILGPSDLDNRRIASGRLLASLIAAQRVPENSDYFPFVDVNAVRSRFMQSHAREFAELSLSDLPLRDMLDEKLPPTSAGPAVREKYDTAQQKAELVRRALLAGRPDTLPGSVSRDASYLLFAAAACPAQRLGGDWDAALMRVMTPLAGNLGPSDTAPLWEKLVPPRCLAALTLQQRRLIQLMQAVSARDAASMAALSAELLRDREAARNGLLTNYLLGAHALGRIASGRPAAVLEPIEQHAREGRISLRLQWLYAIALERAQGQRKTGGSRPRP
jgi:predicted membrane-bound spermidine synthase